MNIKTDLKGVSRKIKAIGHNNRVGLFMADTFARYMNVYVPEDTGALKGSVNIAIPFQVSYETDYAKRCYYGEDITFSKDKNPNATSYWDKKAIAAHQNDIAKEISDFIAKEL